MKYTCCISAPPAAPFRARSAVTPAPQYCVCRYPRYLRLLPFATGGCKSRHNWTVFLNPRRVFYFLLIKKIGTFPTKLRSIMNEKKIVLLLWIHQRFLPTNFQIWASQNIIKQEYIGMLRTFGMKDIQNIKTFKEILSKYH